MCPETEGGLSSPRPPAEQQGEKVVDCEGKDVTAEFRNGAEICLQKVLDSGEEPELAVLKANSPSCGSCFVYDGTFTGTLTRGDGIFAGLIKARGIRVLTEKDISETTVKELKKGSTLKTGSQNFCQDR